MIMNIHDIVVFHSTDGDKIGEIVDIIRGIPVYFLIKGNNFQVFYDETVIRNADQNEKFLYQLENQ